MNCEVMDIDVLRDYLKSCMNPEGGGGPSMKNHKSIGFLSNSGPDHLETQHSMLDHHQQASETPLKWPIMTGL